MKRWTFIEASDTFVGGLTEDGDKYWELAIEGYNDFEDLSDIETIVLVRGIQKQAKRIIDIVYDYRFEEIIDNETVQLRLKEAVEDIIDMFNDNE